MSKTSLLILVLVFCLITPSIVLASSAGLVIEKQGEEIKTDCVSFDGEYISGYDLLKKSRFSSTVEKGFVTEIDGLKSKEHSAMSGDDLFWSYWYYDTDWQFSNVGLFYSKVYNGEIEGWSFGSGKNNFPSLSINQICSIKQTSAETAVSSQAEEKPLAITSTIASEKKTENSTPDVKEQIEYLPKSPQIISTPSLDTTAVSAGAEDQISKDLGDTSAFLLFPEFNLKNIAITILLFFFFAVIFVFTKKFYLRFLKGRS